MTQAEKPKERLPHFYEALIKFTFEYMEKREEEGNKVKMTEIIGGFEVAKTEFYYTQAWFTKNLVKKQLKAQLDEIIDKLAGTEITIDRQGGIIISRVTKDSKIEIQTSLGEDQVGPSKTPQ